MSQTQNTLIAAAVVALIVGAAVGWFAYPAMNPAGVSQEEYDALEAEYDANKAELTAAQAQIAELTKPKKVGLILATGGLGDKSFNDISYAGCQKAKDELGVDFDYVETTAIAEYEGYQRDFAMSGDYILIVCIGFDQADALTTVAAEYPNQNFALVDMVVDNTNVASLTFRANEGSFLVGVVAGMMTETGQISFVGGMDIPLIRDFFEGYEAGAKWANPEVTVSEPVFVGDWADPTKGKELATALIEQGGDAIYSAAGKSGLGALEAAHEEEVMAFGVDLCQCYLYPEMVASMTKRVDVAVYEMILDALVGTFQGGFYSGGVYERWIGMCRLPEEEALWEELFGFEHQPLPADVLAKVKEARDGILSGDIAVPTGYD
ncbi:MAG: BMP family ABC transporter substrate-binding protein [Candidatus Bathyarchaeota archaeon]|jgi:basic membrane protein A|nr:BMP family ABC transporter substrate-binding protein [Candidatus Bathyarchaeota archaeon]